MKSLRKLVNKLNIFLFSILVSACFIFTGCTKSDELIVEDKDNFAYYLNNANTTITQVSLEGSSFDLNNKTAKEAVDILLSALASEPEDSDLHATLSKEAILNGYTLESGLLVLDFDESYVNLPKTTEVLFRAALARSFTAISDIDSISITVNGEAVLDSAGNSIGILRAEDFVDNPGDEMNAYEQARISLYFANEDGTGLVKESRDVVYSTNISKERLVLDELLKGPNKEGNLATISGERKVISVTTKDGVCYVNLSEKPIDSVSLFSNISEELTLYSIVNSLCELPGINKVSISIEGNSNRMFINEYSLETTYERNLDIVK